MCPMSGLRNSISGFPLTCGERASTARGPLAAQLARDLARLEGRSSTANRAIPQVE